MHAETMLLVHHGEAEVVKADALLKERMGADDDVDRARGEVVEGFSPLGAFCRAR